MGEGGQGRTLLARAPDAPLFRLLDIAPTGGVTLAGVTLQGGEVDIQFFQRGGCIRNQGSFMLWHSTVRECIASIGGGIDSRGDLTMYHSTIIENYADSVGGSLGTSGRTLIESSWIGNNVADTEAGIAVDPRAPVVIRRSVIDGNIASVLNGGGIGGLGTITITSSLVSENISGLRGGGIELLNGELTVTNSTVWENTAEIAGGELYVDDGEATLRGVAVLGNQAGIPAFGIGNGGGIATSHRGHVELERSWVLFNEAAQGPDCSGNVSLLPPWNVVGNPTRFREGTL